MVGMPMNVNTALGSDASGFIRRSPGPGPINMANTNAEMTRRLSERSVTETPKSKRQVQISSVCSGVKAKVLTLKRQSFTAEIAENEEKTTGKGLLVT